MAASVGHYAEQQRMHNQRDEDADRYEFGAKTHQKGSGEMQGVSHGESPPSSHSHAYLGMAMFNSFKGGREKGSGRDRVI